MVSAAETNDQGRDGTLRWQLWSGSHHHQAENKSTAWLPPLTFPELAAGPEEAVAVNIVLHSTLSAALRTGEEEVSLSKQQVHAVANSSDRCR